MTPLETGLALILDMDGVVIDSNLVHRRAWEEFNRRYGVATTEEMHRRMYGRRNDQIIRDFYGGELPDAEVFARGAAKERLYRELARPQLDGMLVPGVREFLVRHAAAPLALATNAEPDNVNFVLDTTGLRRFFRAVVDGHQVEHPKPHPEVYQRAAAELGVAPGACIVFEDSFSGLQAAQAAGMRVVGVRTTHAELPGAVLEIDNFTNGVLESWLGAQKPLA